MELRAQELNLFPVPVWTIDLTTLLADIANDLRSRAIHQLACDPAPNVPFQQTRPVLHELEEAPWPRLFELLRAVAADLIANAYRLRPPPSTLPIRSWAIRMDGSEDYPADSLDNLHSHTSALLSMILWIQVPPEIEGHPSIGTLFRDPNAAFTRGLKGRPNTTVPARLLELLAFPGWIEHAPTCPAPIGRFSEPRIGIVTNVYPEGA